MMKLSAYTLAIAIAATANFQTIEGFTTPAPRSQHSRMHQQQQLHQCTTLHMAGEESEAIFVADSDEDSASSSEEEDDKTFEAVEKLGKGAAKAKRGKRKGTETSTSTTTKTAAKLTPEETFYEGPPAITETIAPTVSILTVIGIIPAAAAWARQAWVRYLITDRRIRVTSGVGGKDMAEIVYPDVTEIRTVKRLFGDGDMVFFLRDGAKFEMRNVPKFEETMDFILKQVDSEVVDLYRKGGNVGAN
mmetsp:Transcript_30763/g.63455  ORF Transcript_30763/g.63455 Transcript_30763/m.63455 type:complete len:247 (+) Transcript_30763:139-879(+)